MTTPKYDLNDRSLWQQCPDDPEMLELIPSVKEEYSKSCEVQLADWVAGSSVHNVAFNECCPDFSCCNPKLLWPEEQRKVFASATPEVQQQMLTMGLQAMIESEENPIPEVYVSGATLPTDEVCQ